MHDDTRQPTLRVRMPKALERAVDAWAEELGTTRSEAARELLTSGLAARGFWPPMRKHADGR